MNKVFEASQNAYQRLRELSGLLRPPVLDDVGLEAAVRTYVSEFSERTGIAANLDFRLNGQQIPEAVVATIYRILQEALTNVHKHAGPARAAISIGFSGGQVSLQIQDDGKGFDKERIAPNHGGGLRGMVERVGLLGGSFALDSALGEGTRICILIPVGSVSHE